MSKHIVNQEYKIKRTDREKKNHHQGKVIWFTGLSGSGKSTLANLVESDLHVKGFKTYVLDGDNLRSGLNQDLGFTKKDREENIRRVAEVAKLFVDAGIVVLAAFITPFEKDRIKIKEIIGKNDFLQIYVDCPLDICESRDVKGLYAKARNKEISNFTGIDSFFEIPQHNDLVIHSNQEEKEVSLNKMLDLILKEINHTIR